MTIPSRAIAAKFVAALVASVLMLGACAGCASQVAGSNPVGGNGANEQTSPPPRPTTTPTPAGEAFDMNFSGTITDPSGYRLALAVHLEIGKASTSTEHAPPGYVDVSVPISGTLTVKNLSVGHDYSLNVQDIGLSDSGQIQGTPEIVVVTASNAPLVVGVLVPNSPGAVSIYTLAGGHEIVFNVGRSYPANSNEAPNTLQLEVASADASKTIADLERPASAYWYESWGTGIVGGLNCGNGSWRVLISTIQSPTCSSFITP